MPDSLTTSELPVAPEVVDRGTRLLMLALPIAFLAHDLGEVRGSEQLDDAMQQIAARVPGVRRLPVDRMATTPRQLGVAVGLLAAALTAVGVRAAVRPPRSEATADFAAVTAVVGGHLVAHIGQSIMVRRPMPGLTGGLAITVPYSVLVLRRLRRRGYLEPGSVGRRGARFALAVPPLLATVRLIGRRLA